MSVLLKPEGPTAQTAFTPTGRSVVGPVGVCCVLDSLQVALGVIVIGDECAEFFRGNRIDVVRRGYQVTGHLLDMVPVDPVGDFSQGLISDLGVRVEGQVAP